jgi:predicted Fe-Mo cluster-binding NifX family protein
MSRIAVHHWQDRIAPVFDTGGRVLVLEDGTDERDECLLLRSQPLQRAEDLRAQGVGTLICGAISRSMREALVACDIRVVGFVAGDLEQVIAAWKSGGLDETFAMPGCRGAGFGFGGKGWMQHQTRRTESCHAEMEQDHRGLDRRPGAEPGCARIRNRRGAGESASGSAWDLDREEDGDFADG